MTCDQFDDMVREYRLEEARDEEANEDDHFAELAEQEAELLWRQ
ncbi:hypothetical protein [Frigoribacterium sp. CG_9.8]|nr:hypothetical protein [Frigoribacterium sp. CG_9.8]MBG6106603.1 hypothetical protein [Frigoribacterium sp. CG_9.8]